MDQQIIKTISQTLDIFTEELEHAKTVADLDLLNLKYLGRQGVINRLFKTLPLKENPQIGQHLNKLKNQIQTRLVQNTDSFINSQTEQEEDLTIPGIRPEEGSLHLITQTIEEIQSIFEKQGFVRRRYPEVDTDWYYAEGLNIPQNHPARDDQETFYLSDNVVLTAHTSNGQLHEMEYIKNPPIKMVNIGKTYRRQADLTHNSMFHQFEGLVIDKNINITHLIGVTNYFAKAFFGEDRVTRLRPHHFQFTEPSFEIDISCDQCHGTGKIGTDRCKICKSGWLELGGAGMVHPNVLKNGSIDPEIYTGFAFGWGVERVLMMKSGLNLPDLRQLYTDDIRFLQQF